MVERNAGLPPDRRIDFRIGIHLGDVVEENDGDLMGDGVNIAARFEGIARARGKCISEHAYWQVRARLDLDGQRSWRDATQEHRRSGPSLFAASRTPRPGEAPRSGQLAAPGKPSRRPLPDKPSIAVLAFNNMSGDAEQEYFSDGISEDIITDLSKLVRVARDRAQLVFRLQESGGLRACVAKALGVRYVLEGSVRKAGNRLRIAGQLIEAGTGVHVWADRYDGALEDVFDLQDKITAAIIGIIEPNIRRAEIERAQRKRPEQPRRLRPVSARLCRIWPRACRKTPISAWDCSNEALEARSQICRRPRLPGVGPGNPLRARGLRGVRRGRRRASCAGRADVRGRRRHGARRREPYAPASGSRFCGGVGSGCPRTLLKCLLRHRVLFWGAHPCLQRRPSDRPRIMRIAHCG